MALPRRKSLPKRRHRANRRRTRPTPPKASRATRPKASRARETTRNPSRRGSGPRLPMSMPIARRRPQAPRPTDMPGPNATGALPRPVDVPPAAPSAAAPAPQTCAASRRFSRLRARPPRSRLRRCTAPAQAAPVQAAPVQAAPVPPAPAQPDPLTTVEIKSRPVATLDDAAPAPEPPPPQPEETGIVVGDQAHLPGFAAAHACRRSARARPRRSATRAASFLPRPARRMARAVDDVRRGKRDLSRTKNHHRSAAVWTGCVPERGRSLSSSCVSVIEHPAMSSEVT